MRKEDSSNEEESRKVSEVIMDEICSEIFGLDGIIDEDGDGVTTTANNEENNVQNNTNNQVQNGAKNDFFQTLSFYDDDPMDVPFESLFDSVPSGTDNSAVPSEFTQQPFPDRTSSQEESKDVVVSVIENVLDQVLCQGVAPRKVATVHPFSLNNSLPSSDQSSGEVPGSSGLRLAGFAVDPSSSSETSSVPSEDNSARPVLKLANFGYKK